MAGRPLAASSGAGAHLDLYDHLVSDVDVAQPPPKRQKGGGGQKGGGKMQAGAPAKQTAKGKTICAEFNLGQCRQGPRCTRGLHLCNGVSPNGQLCGATNKARCDHHPKGK